jgi:hypothetical protein
MIMGVNLKVSAPTVSVSYKGLISVDGKGSAAKQGTGAGASGAIGMLNDIQAIAIIVL